jgi:hypothetical protein
MAMLTPKAEKSPARRDASMLLRVIITKSAPGEIAMKMAIVATAISSCM